MLNQEKILSTLKEKQTFLTKEFGVKKIGLFGSFAQNLETEKSDVDILIEFEKPIGFKFFELVEFLENLFQRKVEIITKEGLKSIRVRNVQDSIRESVLYV